MPHGELVEDLRGQRAHATQAASVSRQESVGEGNEGERGNGPCAVGPQGDARPNDSGDVVKREVNRRAGGACGLV